MSDLFTPFPAVKPRRYTENDLSEPALLRGLITAASRPGWLPLTCLFLFFSVIRVFPGVTISGGGGKWLLVDSEDSFFEDFCFDSGDIASRFDGS